MYVVFYGYVARGTKNNESPLDAWKSIVENPEKACKYKQARGKGGFIRANWDEVLQLVSASLLYTVIKYGRIEMLAFHQFQLCRC